jgi:hypothetical protein
MENQGGLAPRTPAVFKFEGAIYLFIAGLLVDALALFVYFVYLQARHGPITFYEVIGFIFFVVTIIALPGAGIGQSDIVVTELGISRRFLGWTWRTILWNNVREIQIVPFYHPAFRKMVRMINIYPPDIPRMGIFHFGVLGFSDTLKNFNELRDIMNYYVRQHDIKIKAVAAYGKIVPPSL